MTREEFKNYLFSLGIESEEEQKNLCENARALFRGETIEEIKEFSTAFYNQKNINGASYVPLSYLLEELKQMKDGMLGELQKLQPPKKQNA